MPRPVKKIVDEQIKRHGERIEGMPDDLSFRELDKPESRFYSPRSWLKTSYSWGVGLKNKYISPREFNSPITPRVTETIMESQVDNDGDGIPESSILIDGLLLKYRYRYGIEIFANYEKEARITVRAKGRNIALYKDRGSYLAQGKSVVSTSFYLKEGWTTIHFYIAPELAVYENNITEEINTLRVELKAEGHTRLPNFTSTVPPIWRPAAQGGALTTNTQYKPWELPSPWVKGWFAVPHDQSVESFGVYKGGDYSLLNMIASATTGADVVGKQLAYVDVVSGMDLNYRRDNTIYCTSSDSQGVSGSSALSALYKIGKILETTNIKIISGGSEKAGIRIRILRDASTSALGTTEADLAAHLESRYMCTKDMVHWKEIVRSDLLRPGSYTNFEDNEVVDGKVYRYQMDIKHYNGVRTDKNTEKSVTAGDTTAPHDVYNPSGTISQFGLAQLNWHQPMGSGSRDLIAYNIYMTTGDYTPVSAYLHVSAGSGAEQIGTIYENLKDRRVQYTDGGDDVVTGKIVKFNHQLDRPVVTAYNFLITTVDLAGNESTGKQVINTAESIWSLNVSNVTGYLNARHDNKTFYWEATLVFDVPANPILNSIRIYKNGTIDDHICSGGTIWHEITDVGMPNGSDNRTFTHAWALTALPTTLSGYIKLRNQFGVESSGVQWSVVTDTTGPDPVSGLTAWAHRPDIVNGHQMVLTYVQFNAPYVVKDQNRDLAGFNIYVAGTGYSDKIQFVPYESIDPHGDTFREPKVLIKVGEPEQHVVNTSFRRPRYSKEVYYVRSVDRIGNESSAHSCVVSGDVGAPSKPWWYLEDDYVEGVIAGQTDGHRFTISFKAPTAIDVKYAKVWYIGDEGEEFIATKSVSPSAIASVMWYSLSMVHEPEDGDFAKVRVFDHAGNASSATVGRIIRRVVSPLSGPDMPGEGIYGSGGIYIDDNNYWLKAPSGFRATSGRIGGLYLSGNVMRSSTAASERYLYVDGVNNQLKIYDSTDTLIMKLGDNIAPNKDGMQLVQGENEPVMQVIDANGVSYVNLKEGYVQIQMSGENPGDGQEIMTITKVTETSAHCIRIDNRDNTVSGQIDIGGFSYLDGDNAIRWYVTNSGDAQFRRISGSYRCWLTFSTNATTYNQLWEGNNRQFSNSEEGYVVPHDGRITFYSTRNAGDGTTVSGTLNYAINAGDRICLRNGNADNGNVEVQVRINDSSNATTFNIDKSGRAHGLIEVEMYPHG